MQRKSVFTAFALSLAMSGLAIAGPNLVQTKLVKPVAPVDLQTRIDQAQPGEIVRAGSGTFYGPITLREGVVLLGSGAGVSIIDGAGRGPAVIGARESIVMGFTIQNGTAGITNDGNYMGIFQNVITGNTEMGIHVVGGSAVIANNLISGNKGIGGIAANSSNPYVLNNTIVDNDHGIWGWYAPGPTVMNNVFAGNKRAMSFGAGAEGKSGLNLVDTHQGIAETGHDNDFIQPVSFNGPGDYTLAADVVAGRSGHVNEAINPTGVIGIAFDGKPGIADYQKLMGRMLSDAVANQPVVIYDLTTTPGLFGVTTKFPTATFGTKASTPDTVIREYSAFDSRTDFFLNAQLTTDGEYPMIKVENDDFKETGHDRYVLENVFFHGPSLRFEGDSKLIFERLTGFSRIEILVPEGFIPTSVNYPANFEKIGDRYKVSINQIGMTNVSLQMESDTVQVTDVFDVREITQR